MKPAVQTLVADQAQAGQRLDNWLLARLKGAPRTLIYRILRSGEVRVNSGRVAPSYRVVAGDRIRIPPIRLPEPDTPSAPPRRWLDALRQAVLFEDEALLVLDKPAGLAAHGGSGISHGVIEVMQHLHPDWPGLALAHRLDRETSGCLLLAKDRPALLALHAALQSGGVEKHYTGLLHGRLPLGREIRVDAPLEKQRERGGERVVEVSSEGQRADTRIKPLRHYGGATLADIRLGTGRMHQARVHCAHIGHPLAGDDKYGDRAFNRELRPLGLKRHFLHAASLALRHPVSGERLRIEAPLPADLQTVLDRLSRR
jgi:23S rRNA pseudouridine955/2504/2580 synthase